MQDEPGGRYAFRVSANAIDVIAAAPHLFGVSADAVMHGGAFTIEVCAIVDRDNFHTVDSGCWEPWRRESMLWSGQVRRDDLVPFGAELRDGPQRHGRLKWTHNELLPIVAVTGAYPVRQVLQERMNFVFTSNRNFQCMSGRPLGEVGPSFDGARDTQRAAKSACGAAKPTCVT